jgi:hypothetical protein
MGEDKADHGESSKPTEILTSSVSGKRNKAYFSEDEILLMTNMTDAVNNIANALRDDTRPTHVDGDLYHAVIACPQGRPSLWPSTTYWATSPRAGGM